MPEPSSCTNNSEAVLAWGDRPTLPNLKISQGGLCLGGCPCPAPFQAELQRRHQTSASAVRVFRGKQFQGYHCCQHALGQMMEILWTRPSQHLVLPVICDFHRNLQTQNLQQNRLYWPDGLHLPTQPTNCLWWPVERQPPLPCPFLGPCIMQRQQTSASTMCAFWGNQLWADQLCLYQLPYHLGISQGSVELPQMVVGLTDL